MVLLGTASSPLHAEKRNLSSSAASDPSTIQPATSSSMQTNVILGNKITEQVYNGSSYNTKISYFDHGNRLLQTISIGASPSGKDIVNFYEYDSMGRSDSVSYMSYTIASTGGTKRSDPIAEQKAFYQNLFPSEDDYNYAYSSKKYVTAPFTMVKEEGEIGKKYSLDGGAKKHTTTYIYSKNIANYYAHKYVVAINDKVASLGSYPAGELLETKSYYTAEDGK